MPPKHLAHLNDILESIRLILMYVEGLTFQAYVDDLKARDAVERRFAVIGEALSRLKRDAPEVHAGIDQPQKSPHFVTSSFTSMTNWTMRSFGR